MASTQGSGRHTAGAFDIRNFIGALLGIYGLILAIYSFTPSGQAPEKTGDINANLVIGIGLLVVGGAFMTWARLRPVVVPEHVDAPAPGDVPDHGDGDRPSPTP